MATRFCRRPTATRRSEVWQEHKKEIALLLTDLVMPGNMNGRELAEKLWAEQPGLKVIFTSGYSADIVGKDFKLEPEAELFPKALPAASPGPDRAPLPRRQAQMNRASSNFALPRGSRLNFAHDNCALAAGRRPRPISARGPSAPTGPAPTGCTSTSWTAILCRTFPSARRSSSASGR